MAGFSNEISGNKGILFDERKIFLLSLKSNRQKFYFLNLWPIDQSNYTNLQHRYFRKIILTSLMQHHSEMGPELLLKIV